MYGTRTYNSWRGMVQRCTNPNSANYSNYGDRGITVCEYYREFGNWYADMLDRPSGMTLDRVDNNGNYEPGNLQWATPAMQVANRRPRKRKRRRASLADIQAYAAALARAAP
jgi:hypothetical protein